HSVRRTFSRLPTAPRPYGRRRVVRVAPYTWVRRSGTGLVSAHWRTRSGTHLLEVRQLPRPQEDFVCHLLGQPPGERVLLTGVVGAQEQAVLDPVPEARPRTDTRLARRCQEAEGRVPGEPPEADDHRS